MQNSGANVYKGSDPLVRIAVTELAGFGAVETLAAASPTAATPVMRRDGSTSVAPALSAGRRDQPWLLMK